MTDRTPDRIIINNNDSPPHHLMNISSLAKKFYNNMKIQEEKRKKEKEAVTITRTHDDDLPDERYVCIPVDDCAICCERDTISNLFKTTCGHVFHADCLKRWCDHNNTCPNCRSLNPFGYDEPVPFNNTKRTLNFSVNMGFIESDNMNSSYNNIIDQSTIDYYNNINNNIIREREEAERVRNEIIEHNRIIEQFDRFFYED